MIVSKANKQLVSIVLPTYNRAQVLPYAIRSILQQTYTDWELIIVDDNSSDTTAEVIRSFSDPRILYIRNDPNLKLPRALNKGFKIAKGDLMTWTSDDNILGDRALEVMVYQLQTNNCDFVYADYYLFSEQDNNGQPLDIHLDKLPDQIQLEKGNHIGACFLYTREVYEHIGEYDPDLFLVEDYDYFIRISKAFRMFHINEPLYYFRRDDNTLYCSRYCQVKASDFLVRYKNRLIDESAVISSIVSLIFENINTIKNPYLRYIYRNICSKSYRLTLWYKRWFTRYISLQLEVDTLNILSAFKHNEKSFKDARDELCCLLQKFGTIEYNHF